MKPKKETKLLTGIVSGHGGNILAPGTLGPGGNFDTFIVRRPSRTCYGTVTDIYRKPLDLPEESLKTPGLLGYLRMSYWTRFMSALSFTITGLSSL